MKAYTVEVTDGVTNNSIKETNSQRMAFRASNSYLPNLKENEMIVIKCEGQIKFSIRKEGDEFKEKLYLR